MFALGFGGNQWVLYARSMFGLPDLENRSRRRSLVQLTYTVSLGRKPALSAHFRNTRIAVLILGRADAVSG